MPRSDTGRSPNPGPRRDAPTVAATQRRPLQPAGRIWSRSYELPADHAPDRTRARSGVFPEPADARCAPRRRDTLSRAKACLRQQTYKGEREVRECFVVGSSYPRSRREPVAVVDPALGGDGIGPLAGLVRVARRAV